MTLQLENAQLVKTSNDSLYRLTYIYGVNYECIFSKSNQKNKKENETEYAFKCLINGASQRAANDIYIKFRIEVRPKSGWEGKYYYAN